MARRGFSLIELMLVITLTALTIGVTVSLYGYSVNRLSQATARYASVDQVRKLQDEIASVIRDSVAATVVNTANGPALRCTLAFESKKGTTSTGGATNKVADTAEPIAVTRRGYEKHGSGKRIWFYLADGNGTFGSIGTHAWRAERTDDSTPTPGDLVTSWRNHPGTSNPRFDLITSVGFVVNSTLRTVAVTVAGRSLWRDERTGSTSDKASQAFSETRTTGWRNWFQ